MMLKQGFYGMAVAPLPIGNEKRCKCTECGNVFSSLSGFDSHRKGEHGTPERRCVYPGFVGMRIKALRTGRLWYTPAPEGFNDNYRRAQ